MFNKFLISNILSNIFSNIHLFFIIIFLYVSTNAFGNTSKWNNYKNDYIDIAFLKAWDVEQGELFALFIKMKKNWKTYWKYPGESGFAPEFKLLNSKNYNTLDIAWPTPQVIEENGTIIYGYQRNLILPIFFYKKKNNTEMEFEFELTIGFCNDICIPTKFYMNSKNALTSVAVQNKLILKSLSKEPIKLSASENSPSCNVEKIESKMLLYSKFDDDFFSRRNNIEELIIEYMDEQIWFSEIKKINNNLNYMAKINIMNEKNFLLNKSKIIYTIITRDGGFQKIGCKSVVD